jgi:hypothetical protein
MTNSKLATKAVECDAHEVFGEGDKGVFATVSAVF